MAYFEKFPKGVYSNDNITSKQVTNIFKRVKIRQKVIDEASLYQEYDVPNGERPEDTAMKHFGDPQYHWVILMTNGSQDGFYDWPLDFICCLNNLMVFKVDISQHHLNFK